MKKIFKFFFPEKEIRNCIYKEDCYSCQVILNEKKIGDIFFSKQKTQFIIYRKRIAKGNLKINNTEEQVLYDGDSLTIRYKGKNIFSARCSNDIFQKIVDILKSS